MSKRGVVALACVAALAGVSVGCGGDEEEELTAAQFKQRANAICKRLNEDTAAGYTSVYENGSQPKQAEMRRLAESVFMPNLEARLEQLRELTPPQADEAEVEKMLDALEAGIEKAREQGALPYSETGPLFERANELALGYGLRYCFTA